MLSVVRGISPRGRRIVVGRFIRLPELGRVLRVAPGFRGGILIPLGLSRVAHEKGQVFAIFKLTRARPSDGGHSMTRMFRWAHISLRMEGQTATLTSPRWAFFRMDMTVRD